MQGSENFLPVPCVVDERFAVVRKWQGDHSAAGQPTADATKDHPIRQRASGGGSRINHGSVAVGSAQRFEPARRVKDRRVWVSLGKLGPAFVLQRIDGVNQDGLTN